MARSMPAAIGVVVGALVLTGCSGPSPAPSPSVPHGTASPSPGASVFDCIDPIDETSRIATGMRAVLDVVAFTDQRTEPTREGDRLWSKTGVQVRSGARFEIRSLTPGVTFRWNNTGDDRVVSHVIVDGCRGTGHDDWLAYPGGFRLRAPVCAELEVAAGGRTARTRVPLGAAC